jgi:two-component system sensor histidine kinase/response regulator
MSRTPRCLFCFEKITPVNQRLIVRLLEKRGHRVWVGSDGTRAVQLTGELPFDLVLMDIQMPEMDGLAATVAIRRREAGSGAHLFIVALTAHAIKRDQELCLSSRMDGYLTKPIRPQDLDELLKLRVAARTSSSSPECPKPVVG